MLTLLGVLSVGCPHLGFAPTPEQAAPTSANTPSRLHGPVRAGRWMLAPSWDGRGSTSNTRKLIDGLRVEFSSDGGVHQASERITVDDVRSLELPERLGGGFLFYGEEDGFTYFWHARSWSAELNPIFRVKELIDGVFPGFESVYLKLALSERLVGLDIHKKEPVAPFGLPHAASFQSAAIVDAWFGAVATEVRGVLVTFDAGATWSALHLPGYQYSVEARQDSVLIRAGTELLEVDSNGAVREHRREDSETLFARLNRGSQQLVAEQDEPTHPVEPRLGFPGDPLRLVVMYGFALSQDEGVVAAGGALSRVSLTDGRLLNVRRDAYSGPAACPAIAMGEGVAFVCSSANGDTLLYRWVPPLGMELERRFIGPRRVRSNGQGAIAIDGSCSDSRASAKSAPHCFWHADYGFTELQIPKGQTPSRVMALGNQGTAVLSGGSDGSPGTITIVKGTQSTTQQLRVEGDRDIDWANVLWLDALEQLNDTTVGTWLVDGDTYYGARIQKTGEVQLSSRAGSSVRHSVFNGAIAFEVGDGGVFHETTNYGFDWHSGDAPEGARLAIARDDRRHTNTADVGCSLVGCVSGDWQRVGFASPEAPREYAATAKEPTEVSFTPGSYAEWQVTCHATGNALSAPQAPPGERRQKGAHVDFNSLTALQSPSNLDGGSPHGTEFKDFEGTKAPRAAGRDLHLDAGSSHRLSFHAYAWGANSDPGWSVDSAWKLWIAGRFGLDGTWGTATSAAPWTTATRASERFGALPAHQSTNEWALSLDATERRGLLRVGSRADTELHVVEPGRAIRSFGNLSLGAIASATYADGAWYFGQRDSGLLHLFRLEETGPRKLKSYPLGVSNRPQLVTSTDELNLGILVHTLRGDWYLYPLDENFEGQDPIHYSREELNAPPQACTVIPGGFWVSVEVPPTRPGGADGTGLFRFEGELADWTAHRAFVKLAASQNGFCVAEMGAELARGGTPYVKPEAAVPRSGFPLSVRDKRSGQRFEFQCAAP